MIGATNSIPAAKVCNPNLLHNPWFTVNQRQISGNISGNNYVADRWRNYNTGYCNVNNSTISFYNGTVYQIMDPSLNDAIIGTLCTASIELANGDIISGSAVVESSGETEFYSQNNLRITVTIGSSITKFNIESSSTSLVSIIAAKLELGSISTLIHEAAPDYTSELLKCQRYFIRKSVSGNGYLSNASKNRYVIFDLPVPMRITNPTITVTGTIIVRGDVGYDTAFPSAGGTPSSVSVYQGQTIEKGTIAVSFVHNTASNITNNTAIAINSQNAYVDISADL